MLVAGNTRVWRLSQAILTAEAVNNEAPKFCLKVEFMEGDAQKLAGAL